MSEKSYAFDIEDILRSLIKQETKGFKAAIWANNRKLDRLENEMTTHNQKYKSERAKRLYNLRTDTTIEEYYSLITDINKLIKMQANNLNTTEKEAVKIIKLLL